MFSYGENLVTIGGWNPRDDREWNSIAEVFSENKWQTGIIPSVPQRRDEIQNGFYAFAEVLLSAVVVENTLYVYGIDHAWRLRGNQWEVTSPLEGHQLRLSKVSTFTNGRFVYHFMMGMLHGTE